MLRSFRTVATFVVLALLGSASADAVIIGPDPQGLAVNPITGRVYVANSTSDSVTVIDGASSTVLATVPVGDFPEHIAVNAASNRVYVGNREAATLSVIDGASSTVLSTIPLAGFPTGIAADAATGRLYVSVFNQQLSRVDVFDASNTLVDSVAIVGPPGSLAVNPQEHRLYVANVDQEGGGVVVVDTTTDAVVTTIPIDGGSSTIVVNQVTNLIYVANGNGKAISVIDGTTNQVVATIDAASLGTPFSNPFSMAVNERTNKLYSDAGDPPGGQILEIDGTTRQITRRFQIGLRNIVYGMGLDDRRGRVYVITPTLNLAVLLDKELLANSSFEEPLRKRFPSDWKRRNLDALDAGSEDSFDARRSFHIVGVPAVTKRFAQDISVSGSAGAALHFEGFSKASGASETGGSYAIVFNVYYDDGTQRTVHRQFSRGTHDWERQFGRIVAAKPFSRLSYRIDYADQSGEAWFDAFHVSMESPVP